VIQNKALLERTKSHHIGVFNTLLWGCSFLLLLFLFSGRTSPERIDYIYTICFITTLIVPVSINLYFLIPSYLKKEKNILFSVFFVLNLVVFSELNPLFFKFIINTFFNDYYFISYHNDLEIYLIFFLFFILSTLIKLGEDWVYLNQVENKVLKAQKQEIEHQLYSLKGQINPHFLFNSLNVLYSLAIDKKEDLTNAILQLSDILRYVLYDIEADKIPLSKEIELIKNFIAFEKNRQIKNSKITFHYNIDEQKEIYPMLFLPLIENSFKHGLKSGVQNPYVNIDVTEEDTAVLFCISNNFKTPISKEQRTDKGIGLKNIKENLAIIYPEKHTFKTEIKEDVYMVKLVIDLKQ
jgi:hypothetical protein